MASISMVNSTAANRKSSKWCSQRTVRWIVVLGIELITEINWVV